VHVLAAPFPCLFLGLRERQFAPICYHARDRAPPPKRANQPRKPPAPTAVTLTSPEQKSSNPKDATTPKRDTSPTTKRQSPRRMRSAPQLILPDLLRLRWQPTLGFPTASPSVRFCPSWAFLEREYLRAGDDVVETPRRTTESEGRAPPRRTHAGCADSGWRRARPLNPWHIVGSRAGLAGSRPTGVPTSSTHRSGRKKKNGAGNRSGYPGGAGARSYKPDLFRRAVRVPSGVGKTTRKAVCT